MNVKYKAGFTLIEIMSVVIIIGLLVSLAVPGFQKLMRQTQNSRFLADLRMIEGNFHSYSLAMGKWPKEGKKGKIPNGMADYLQKTNWQSDTVLGGNWDWDNDKFGIEAGISWPGSTRPEQGAWHNQIPANASQHLPHVAEHGIRCQSQP